MSRAAVHIVNVSGGKDSAATYLLALERGRPFRAVTADTGHEAPETYDWIRALPARTGGPEVEVVRADFSAQIARKREFVATRWRADGVPEAQIERALAVLRPTGIPFLDLCLWKGRFPSARARFCTEFLKADPIERQVVRPALDLGPLLRWQGERRAESAARARLPRIQTVRGYPHRLTIYRPILAWSARDVFAIHDRHGLPPNPLYLQGMGRVGCFPCIMARKEELAALARRFPEAVARLEEWEALVKAAAKRGAATFFPSDRSPRGVALTRELEARAWRETRAAHPGIPGEIPDPEDPDTLIRNPELVPAYKRALSRLVASADWPGAGEILREWALTDRGGRQFNLLDEIDASAACSSQYGLCE